MTRFTRSRTCAFAHSCVHSSLFRVHTHSLAEHRSLAWQDSVPPLSLYLRFSVDGISLTALAPMPPPSSSASWARGWCFCTRIFPHRLTRPLKHIFRPRAHTHVRHLFANHIKALAPVLFCALGAWLLASLALTFTLALALSLALAFLSHRTHTHTQQLWLQASPVLFCALGAWLVRGGSAAYIGAMLIALGQQQVCMVGVCVFVNDVCFLRLVCCHTCTPPPAGRLNQL